MVATLGALAPSSSAQRLVRSVAAWTVLMLFVGQAVGQQSSHDLPLTVDVHSSSYTSRTSGPIPLRLQVNWGGPSVLQGDLLLELRDGSEILGSFTLPDQFLTPGQQELNLLLPPLTEGAYSDFYDLGVAFRRDGQTTTLATQQLRIPGAATRKFVLMVSVPELELLQSETSQRSDGWEFDRIQPEVQRGDRARLQRNLTLTSTIASEELPTQPLRYCAWDVLLITDTGFAILDGRQRESLHAWVRAGGSLIVVLSKSAIPTSHVKALNDLLAEHPQQAQLLPRSDSPPLITVSGGNEVSHVTSHSGLGRIAVLMDTVNERTISRELSPVIWKLCQDQAIEVQAVGEWSLELARTSRQSMFGPGSYVGNIRQFNVRALLTNLEPHDIGGGNELTERLLPRQFKLVPLWLMGSVLGLFILAIGPLDYLWLGLLPSRKWTWITFPLLAFGFTGAAVAISNSYMDTGEHRGRLVLRDITDGGIVARENELQLLFNNTSGLISTELTSSLFTPLQLTQDTEEDFGWNSGGQQSNEPAPRVGPPRLDGFLPQSAVAVQSVPQWTPQLNRLFRIPASPQKDDSGFDWDAPISWSAPDDLQKRATAAFGPEATVHLYVAARELRSFPYYTQIVVQGDKELMATGSPSRVLPPTSTNTYGNPAIRTSDFLTSISVRPQGGLFAVVSQIAPNGGNQLEDLTLLDTTNLNSLLLIIAVPQADGALLVYRRLFPQGASRQ